MDALDELLLDAFERVAGSQRDPGVAARKPMPPRGTPRAWCLAIRASDTRLNDYHCLVEPLRTNDLDADAVRTGEADIEDEYDSASVPSSDLRAPHSGAPSSSDLVRYRLPHRLTITAEDVRRLCAPVKIPWPGVPWTDAAAMLGMHEENLRSWMHRRALRVRYEDASVHGKRGKRVPIVWCDHPIDPSAMLGSPPDPLWGSMWMYHVERIGAGFEQTLIRLPRTRDFPDGSVRFRGYHFLCPGCRRFARKLYFPLPVFTACDLLGHARESSGPQMQTFACHRCHRIRNFSRIDRNSWNELIRHLSAGYLSGSDVPRPADFKAIRRRAFRHHKPRPAPRRDQVLELLLSPAAPTRKQIATQLGTGLSTVHECIKTLYRMHGVHSVGELATTLGRPREMWGGVKG